MVSEWLNWRVYNMICNWGMTVLINKVGLWSVIWRRSTGFLDLFYGKSEVSVKTLLIFLFYCGQVSRENCCKNGGYSFIIFLASKMKLTDGFMNFTWHKIMKPPHSVWKKNETDGRGEPLEIMKPQSVLFLMPKKW